MKKGIDVSAHQGKINWEAVKSDGVQFAIIRAGVGRYAKQKDAFFEANYAGCKANGIPCGVYWYSYALTPDEARKEADACLEVIKGKSFEYPIYFDIEEPKQLALGRVTCTEIAKAFLSKVEAAGYWVGIYSSKSHLEHYISEAVRKRYAVWVAHYTTAEKTSYNGDYGIWQYGIAGDKKHDTRGVKKVKGIAGACDLNYGYVEYPFLIAAKGLNGIKMKEKDEKEPAEKTFEPYTVKVIASGLNIRKTPRWEQSDVVGVIRDKGVYTIVDETMLDNTKFGKLKSGAGWISLGEKYVKKM